MAKDIRWLQRFSNFKKAFAQLEEAVSLPALSKLEQQGLIKGFEITYELAWNTLKDLLQDQGYTGIIGSKDTFRLSNQAGLLTNGDVWMEMVRSRNATSHTYDESTANEITEAIRDNYFFAFERLISTLEDIITGKRSTPDEPSANSYPMPYGLTDTQLAQIQRVLAQTPRLERAVLFGSRAKGTHKPGSDIDLALMGDAFQFADRLRLDNELDDLDLPVFFDLVAYGQISEPALREHIDRVGVTLYSRDAQKAVS